MIIDSPLPYLKPEQFKSYKNFNPIIDLKFPCLIKCTKQTEDRNYLIAYGIYPPQVQCFDLLNFCLKFQRNLNCEINDFHILSPNWEKIIFLRSDRFLEFHSKSGYFYQIKIPNSSSSIIFDKQSNTLLIFSIYNQIFRFSLVSNKFISTINSQQKFNTTSTAKSNLTNIFGIGNSIGNVELWDLRVTRKPIGIIDNTSYQKKKLMKVYLTFIFLKSIYTNYIAVLLLETQPYLIYAIIIQ